ncbi:MAG TPA: carbon-nitrogen hydrolase family protein [Dehalococcoidia bacterium]|nr:carbon-nitrogen hydrolase family protein [Dehalococcoidia bacterium]
MPAKPFIAAAAQLAPVFLDRKKTVEKACTAIAEAAKHGARLIVFPEAFIPTYPDWVWVVPANMSGLHSALYAELVDQSVAIPGPEIEKLCKAAKAGKCNIVVGVNERNASASGTSIYNTLVYISDQGELLGIHRKLVPTAAERLVWTPGDGSTLGVFDTSVGKLGGLICWENYMPLARYAMYAQGAQIFVAATWDSADSWIASMRHIAKEGRLYVIGCCIAMRRNQIPESYEFKSLYPPSGDWVNVGNSLIAGPDGEIIAGPVVQKEEIIYAEIDPARQLGSRYWLDSAGHYARPDVFHFAVNRRANLMMTEAIDPPIPVPASARKRRKKE